MLNQSPIFVNGFSRGGTTILTNLLASHPDVGTVGETHHVFKGCSVTDSGWMILQKCLSRDTPIIASTRQDFFSPRLIKPRRNLSNWQRRMVDSVLYREKIRFDHETLNRYKAEGIEYSREELESVRLLSKNVDGMIYVTDALAEMYPDATFIGLVRSGLALCEGHLRRGRSAEETGRRYRILAEKMIADSQHLPRYCIIRFEDLVACPSKCTRQVYAHADLDISQLQGLRMQIRRVMDEKGQHRLEGGAEWSVVWFDLDAIDSYFHRDVNKNQIKRLSQSDRDAFLREAGPTMEKLGYQTDGACQNGPETRPIETLKKAA